MALVGLRAFVAIALIILAPAQTRSDAGGGYDGLVAHSDRMAGSGHTFTFFKADSAPTLEATAVDLSTAALRGLLASLSRFSIVEEHAGGRDSRDSDKHAFARGNFVLNPSFAREEPKSLFPTGGTDDPVSNLLRPLQFTKAGRDRISVTGVSNSVVPEPAVLILMLLGLPLVMRCRLSGSTR